MKKNKLSIGIIGGAGPTAGALLLQKIITVCQKKYDCQMDADFPHIMLISYPFTDMLGEDIERELVEEQLKVSLDCMISNKVDIAAIACNTLHGFLPSQTKLQLVHMIEETRDFLDQNNWKNPLILCSSTSAQGKLHLEYFPCVYPKESDQKKIDDLILAVTAGCCLKEASSLLNSVIDENQVVVLGCTELSVIHEAEPLYHPRVCNPNQIVAEKLCELAFR